MRWLIIIFVMAFWTGSVQGQEAEPFVYDDHTKRDPFWRLVNPSGAIVNYEKDWVISDMVLEGIMVGEDGNNIAIINGKIVKPNDTVGLYVIQKIESQAIILQKGEEISTLKLKKEE